MTTFGGPGGLSSSPGDTHEYALWDAAYVLGSLSFSERREFEAHLSTCPSCREAVSELSGMPALLAQLDRDYIALIDERGAHASAALPPLRHELLASLLAKVNWRRRRSRLVTWTLAAAAAAALVVGVLVGVQSKPVAPVAVAPVAVAPVAVAVPPHANAPALTMVPANASTTLASTASISSYAWGTGIEMTCRYAMAPENSDRDGDAPGDKLAMVVIGRDGSHTRLATWVTLAGVTAYPGGSTSMSIEQIATVQIVSADDGRVLLQRSL
jgi:anti-sigma-K factor RskA